MWDTTVGSLEVISLIYNHLIRAWSCLDSTLDLCFEFWISPCPDKQWFNVKQWYLGDLYISSVIDCYHDRIPTALIKLIIVDTTLTKCLKNTPRQVKFEI